MDGEEVCVKLDNYPLDMCWSAIDSCLDIVYLEEPVNPASNIEKLKHTKLSSTFQLSSWNELECHIARDSRNSRDYLR